jgi:hypothetical protein
MKTYSLSSWVLGKPSPEEVFYREPKEDSKNRCIEKGEYDGNHPLMRFKRVIDFKPVPEQSHAKEGN